MNKLINICMVGVMTIALTGCWFTKLFDESKKIKISIVDNKTNDVIEGVKCIISSTNGPDFSLESNPGIIKVMPNDGALIINCRKSGYKELNTFVKAGVSHKPSTFDLEGVGNFSFGGSEARGYQSGYVFTMEKVNNFD
jgi:hypothetical protein